MRRAFVVLLLLAACTRKQTPAATDTEERAQPPTEVGDVMPPYNATLLDGTSLNLRSEKGRVVLLNVWATWCAPCRFEIPELQSLHEKYAGRGFKVVGISVDDTGAAGVKQFVADNKITYPIAIDADGSIAALLSTTSLPTTVVIGRDGHIVWRKVGAVMPNETASLDAVVAHAVAKKS